MSHVSADRAERQSAAAPCFDLGGRTALVTGATSGIGRAIAAAFAGAGADLVLVADQCLDEVVNEVESLGRTAHALRVDLATRTGRADTVADLVSDHRIDVLVNNAGRISRGAVESISAQEWTDVIELNLNAAFDLAQVAGRRMIATGRGGKVINMASLLSFQGGLNAASYAVSKHALAGLTRALANEWASRGINVNAIAPGYVETALSAPLREDPERSEAITARIPAGRWATPHDIAGPAVFLASPAADYVHGHVLVVDGGWMAR